MVTKERFSDYEKYTLSSDSLSVSVMTLGATVVGAEFNGQKVVLGRDSAEEYLAHKGDFLGATVGRYANRIGGASFTLDGETYALAANENGNQLHGGPEDWSFREWKAEIVGESAVRFSIFAADGENGFPGNMNASVTFSVEDSALRLEFAGETDKPTVYAPTTHTYFNLNGEGRILNRISLQINSVMYLEPGEGLIPTGNMLPCLGDFYFAELRTIEKNYDHAFVLNGQKACVAEGERVRLTVTTDFPALQLYTGEFLQEPLGKNAGFALEPEFYPDSPNHPEWPSTVLRPGETFHKFVQYTFENKL